MTFMTTTPCIGFSFIGTSRDLPLKPVAHSLPAGIGKRHDFKPLAPAILAAGAPMHLLFVRSLFDEIRMARRLLSPRSPLPGQGDPKRLTESAFAEHLTFRADQGQADR
jgi:hypothetical protein